MKRIILLVTLAIVILSLVTAFAVTAFAAEENITDSGTCGENLTWVFDEATATLTVSGTGSTKDCGEFIYESSSVTATRGDMMPWFNQNYTWKKVKKVVIEEGVTRIGDGIFTRMPVLEEVILPTTVLSIGERAFLGNPKLKTVRLSEGLLEIRQYAFDSCESLEEILIPDSVTVLGKGAFIRCSSLQRVKLSKFLTEIHELCFYWCDIRELMLPDSLIYIGAVAFSGCDITVDGMFELPEGLVELHSDSLSGFNIQDVMLPQNLKVYDNPFDLDFLGNVYVHSENPYFRIEEKCLIENETGILHWGKHATSIPKNITGVAEYAFYGNENLTKAVIPDGVTEIGNAALCNCPNLSYIYLPASVRDLPVWIAGVRGEDAPIITYEVHPDNEQYEVWGRSLVDVSTKTLRYHPIEDPIPSGVERIATGAIHGIAEDLVIPEGVLILNYVIVYDNPNLKTLTLPKSITFVDGDSGSHSSITDIYYNGTREEWKQIDFQFCEDWFSRVTIHFADDPIESETEAVTTAEPTVSESAPTPQESGCGGVVTAPIAVLLVIPALALRKRKGKR